MSAHQPDPDRPDLDDTINVTEAHERLIREAAAAAREKRLLPGGLGEVPLWLLVGCGVVFLIAGGVLGMAGNRFGYDRYVKPGYVRAVPEGASVSGPEPMPALEAYSRRGQKIYASVCNGCHGPDAKGGPAYPSLVGSDWVLGETQRFSMIIINGLEGPTSTGKAFPAPMTPQAGSMTAEDLAAVMTYVRNSFGNEKGDVVSVAQARAAFEAAKARSRSGLVNAEELAAEHVKELPGETIGAEVLVDPVTLEPVAAAGGAADPGDGAAQPAE